MPNPPELPRLPNQTPILAVRTRRGAGILRNASQGRPWGACYNSVVKRLLSPICVLVLFLHSSLAASQSTLPDDAETAAPAIRIDPPQFGRVTWGRNTMRLKYHNAGLIAKSLALKVRTYYADSASGVIWEVTYPLLLPPELAGEFTVDYFVRPDHGNLRVELEALGLEGPVFRQSQDFPFQAPYRAEYLLQPSHLGAQGLEWEGRVYPVFKVRESESFIFYYFPGSDAEKEMERIIPQREKILQKLQKDFQVKMSGKAVFFFYPDAEAARKLTGHRADGWTYGKTIVEVYGPRRKIDPSHELVHLVARQLGTPPVLLAEGLATSKEKNFDNAGKYHASVEDWCRAFLRENALIPLSVLMDYTSFGEDLTRPRIAYPEAACFTNYLQETYGWEKFRRAYAELVNDPNPAVQEKNLTLFENIYGKSLREAESDWKERLSQARGSGLPASVAKKVVGEETVPYLVARGRVLLTSGSEEEAEKVLLEAVALDGTDLEARFWLAQAYHVRKNLTAALTEYEKVIRMGDRTHLMEIAWSQVWAGQILDQSGRREEALLHYRAAESLRERSQVRLEGRMTTSLEAARQGIAHPYVPSELPPE
jgi:tetratricopeptide (TPR) repeat protein